MPILPQWPALDLQPKVGRWAKVVTVPIPPQWPGLGLTQKAGRWARVAMVAIPPRWRVPGLRPKVAPWAKVISRVPMVLVTLQAHPETADQAGLPAVLDLQKALPVAQVHLVLPADQGTELQAALLAVPVIREANWVVLERLAHRVDRAMELRVAQLPAVPVTGKVVRLVNTVLVAKVLGANSVRVPKVPQADMGRTVAEGLLLRAVLMGRRRLPFGLVGKTKR
jgi:hypothetical protein